uniref:Uncharacterized protein n=1 Tax=Rhizophora mucronata TaxID=61149 RepID=A0A2P2QX04_RHIMU
MCRGNKAGRECSKRQKGEKKLLVRVQTITKLSIQ